MFRQEYPDFHVFAQWAIYFHIGFQAGSVYSCQRGSKISPTPVATEVAATTEKTVSCQRENIDPNGRLGHDRSHSIIWPQRAFGEILDKMGSYKRNWLRKIQYIMHSLNIYA